MATSYLPDVPQEYVTVDRAKVERQQVNVADVYQTMGAFLGGYLVNYFNRFGRQWQVYVQAEGSYRTDAANVGQFYVKNTKGDPVPLSAFIDMQPAYGPEFTQRYNLYRCTQLNVTANPGFSSLQAMKALEEVFASKMPKTMGYDYLGMSYQEKVAQQGVSPTVIFGLSLLFVFLILATPILALAATIACSAARISGRR